MGASVSGQIGAFSILGTMVCAQSNTWAKWHIFTSDFQYSVQWYVGTMIRGHIDMYSSVRLSQKQCTLQGQQTGNEYNAHRPKCAMSDSIPNASSG